MGKWGSMGSGGGGAEAKGSAEGAEIKDRHSSEGGGEAQVPSEDFQKIQPQ